MGKVAPGLRGNHGPCSVPPRPRGPLCCGLCSPVPKGDSVAAFEALLGLSSSFPQPQQGAGGPHLLAPYRVASGVRQLREEAWRRFAALDDPRAGLLDMLEGSRGWQGKGPSLEAWVTCELQRWLQAQPHQGPAQCSPGLKQLQARAVRVLAESPPSLVGPLVSIFQLQDADRSPLLARVHQLHQEGKFKEAAMLSTKLKLQPELDVEKMGTPLLLQDKAHLMEHYVDGFPDLQRRLLALMDSWCQPGFDIRVVARQHPKVTSLKLEKLSPKVLSRQVLRLRERFGLDPALCPNVVAQQRLSALRYLCYKRFVEGNMSQENWADHVQDLVGQSEWLQEQLLKLLTSHSDAATAARCALDLSLPEARLPATVAAELSRLRLQGRTAEVPSEDRRDDYYQLPIARENVHFLASWEDLARHKEELLQVGRQLWLLSGFWVLGPQWPPPRLALHPLPPPGGPAEQGTHALPMCRPGTEAWASGTCPWALSLLSAEPTGMMRPSQHRPPHLDSSLSLSHAHSCQPLCLQPGLVGVDLEWRPSFGLGSRPQASLMQVAMEGRVFLLDLLVLSQPAGGQASQAFSQLVFQLLSDPSITKLGYGMAGDLRSLGASCPALAHTEKHLRGSLDLQQVHRQMRVVDVPAPGVDGTKGLRGLSLLVQQVLGKPLDKRQQLSNWDRRPLSEAQLAYAAADAYCLLEVYWALCREPSRFHLSGDLARSPRPRHSKQSGAREPPGPQEASAPPQQVPVAEGEDAAAKIQARAFRVVCDSMLQGLARSLRCLGVDVLVLGTGEDHRRAAEVSGPGAQGLAVSLPGHVSIRSRAVSVVVAEGRGQGFPGLSGTVSSRMGSFTAACHPGSASWSPYGSFGEWA
ncbi:hypothetical protein HPG69_007404 [Diceros bicornis minor]|uniref:3'-5' exonuclease domain-containing protein n=1 Tax=Diceros bicornis minor TaxID=77932 RepID=A0A7J7E7H9_DICBM|nr:hypothetical protein HPG69_007404 [Diceros bicornis minor]